MRLVADGLLVMGGSGFIYKSLPVRHEVRKNGGSDGRGATGPGLALTAQE